MRLAKMAFAQILCVLVLGCAYVPKEHSGLMPRHGNFCGLGHPRTISTTADEIIVELEKIIPIDDIDAVCRDHDICYAKNFRFHVPCDHEMIRALSEIRLSHRCTHLNDEIKIVFGKNTRRPLSDIPFLGAFAGGVNAIVNSIPGGMHWIQGSIFNVFPDKWEPCNDLGNSGQSREWRKILRPPISASLKRTNDRHDPQIYVRVGQVEINSRKFSVMDILPLSERTSLAVSKYVQFGAIIEEINPSNSRIAVKMQHVINHPSNRIRIDLPYLYSFVPWMASDFLRTHENKLNSYHLDVVDINSSKAVRMFGILNPSIAHGGRDVYGFYTIHAVSKGGVVVIEGEFLRPVTADSLEIMESVLSGVYL